MRPSAAPSRAPSRAPSKPPTGSPQQPSAAPSASPASSPTLSPTVSKGPVPTAVVGAQDLLSCLVGKTVDGVYIDALGNAQGRSGCTSPGSVAGSILCALRLCNTGAPCGSTDVTRISGGDTMAREIGKCMSVGHTQVVNFVHQLSVPTILMEFTIVPPELASGECANPANYDTCSTVGQKCEDPTAVGTTGDWECQCVPPATGAAKQGGPATCALDECTATCSTCAGTPTGNQCSDAEPAGHQNCLDQVKTPTSLGDWICLCQAPTTGALSLAAPAYCIQNECTTYFSTCLDAGQDCNDPNPQPNSLNDWTCECVWPNNGSAVARNATCIHDECKEHWQECADAGQECVDADQAAASIGDWQCICPAPATGSRLGGAAVCTFTGECATNSNLHTCTDQGQTCVDPTPASTNNDWECGCVSPASGTSAVASAASCTLDECVADCPTCAKTPTGNVCTDKGQECYDLDKDPRKINDWECKCKYPQAGPSKTNAATVCVLNECLTKYLVCHAAGQVCKDPYTDVTRTDDWQCHCPAGQQGYATAKVAPCVLDECWANEKTCQAEGQVCKDPNTDPNSLNDWECWCWDSVGSKAVGVANCTEVGECVGNAAVCHNAGQACKDPDLSVTGDWGCECAPPQQGNFHVGAPTTCEIDECNVICSHCADPGTGHVCHKEHQGCTDPDKSVAAENDWTCTCPPGLGMSGSPAVGKAAICELDECANFNQVGVQVCDRAPVKQTCVDPSKTVESVGDWKCVCGLYKGKQMTGEAQAAQASCQIDECFGANQDACVNAAQECYDPDTSPQSENDWMCRCIAPANGTQMGGPAVCTFEGECQTAGNRNTCLAATPPQNCVDPTGNAVLNDWQCVCVSPYSGSPALAGTASCHLNECTQKCASCAVTNTGQAANKCTEAGQVCHDPDQSATSTGDWLCECVSPAVGTSAVTNPATCKHDECNMLPCNSNLTVPQMCTDPNTAPESVNDWACDCVDPYSGHAEIRPADCVLNPTPAPDTPAPPPTGQPSTPPSKQPSLSPQVPTKAPETSQPTASPSAAPTRSPAAPTAAPYKAGSPSRAPINPTAPPYLPGTPSTAPTTSAPTAAPYTPSSPSASPQKAPTVAPSASPKAGPTVSPVNPSNAPSASPYTPGTPSKAPVVPPTRSPSLSPRVPGSPTRAPVVPPTVGPVPPPGAPTRSPVTPSPSFAPIVPGSPTRAPAAPTASPYKPGTPSAAPVLPPTKAPAAPPTASPAAAAAMPTAAPYKPGTPSAAPVVPPTSAPQPQPTFAPYKPGTPSRAPAKPTAAPSASPRAPSVAPSGQPPPTAAPYKPGTPSAAPMTAAPSASPYKPGSPSKAPAAPTASPYAPGQPTGAPSAAPSASPYLPGAPSKAPVQPPTASPYAPGQPTGAPTAAPSVGPYLPGTPSKAPALPPTASPAGPSAAPVVSPTASPYKPGTPSAGPAAASPPTASPAKSATISPTAPPYKPGQPSAAPVVAPTVSPYKAGSPSRAPWTPISLSPVPKPTASPYTPGQPSASPVVVPPPPSTAPSSSPTAGPYTPGSPSAAPVVVTGAPKAPPTAPPYTPGSPSAGPEQPTAAPAKGGTGSPPTVAPTADCAKVSSQTDCESKGCKWDGGQCRGAAVGETQAPASSDSNTALLVILIILGLLLLLCAIVFIFMLRKQKKAMQGLLAEKQTQYKEMHEAEAKLEKKRELEKEEAERKAAESEAQQRNIDDKAAEIKRLQSEIERKDREASVAVEDARQAAALSARDRDRAEADHERELQEELFQREVDEKDRHEDLERQITELKSELYQTKRASHAAHPETAREIVAMNMASMTAAQTQRRSSAVLAPPLASTTSDGTRFRVKLKQGQAPISPPRRRQDGGSQRHSSESSPEDDEEDWPSSGRGQRLSAGRGAAPRRFDGSPESLLPNGQQLRLNHRSDPLGDALMHDVGHI